jgi:hypothetical protein
VWILSDSKVDIVERILTARNSSPQVRAKVGKQDQAIDYAESCGNDYLLDSFLFQPITIEQSLEPVLFQSRNSIHFFACGVMDSIGPSHHFNCNELAWVNLQLFSIGDIPFLIKKTPFFLLAIPHWIAHWLWHIIAIVCIFFNMFF